VHHRKCGKIFFVRDLLGERFFWLHKWAEMNNGVSPFSFSYRDMFCCSIWNFILYVDPCLLGSFFLDPEDVWSLSLWAIWNFIKEQGSHELDVRLWGTKGLSERPMCIRTERAQPHLLIYSILFYSTPWSACSMVGLIYSDRMYLDIQFLQFASQILGEL